MTFKSRFDRETRASRNEATDDTAVSYGWLESLIVALQSKVPAGYEDADGFHFGAEPDEVS